MFLLKRASQAEPLPAPEPPSLDPSVRRQGAVEALNLIARSVSDAVHSARQEAEPGKPNNFVAGQLMAFGHVVACIEQERELLQQQLVHEAGLHAPPAAPVWDEEMRLLDQLPVSSEELFRLAMDFRKVEEPEPAEPVEGPKVNSESPVTEPGEAEASTEAEVSTEAEADPAAVAG